MSTILEGQLITWRAPARPRDGVSAVEVLRLAVIVVAVAAAVVYFATTSQTPAVVSTLVREAAARPGSTPDGIADRPSPVVVTMRPSARDGSQLQP
jgi:hypothetical protein